MFTGLVEELGVVTRLQKGADGGSFVIRAEKVLDGTAVGDSIAVSGACLTVTALGRGEFTAYCMPETLQRTTLGKAKPGTEVNLERSLRLGDRIGGHLVLGHVDGVGSVTSLERQGLSVLAHISMPDELSVYVAEKGSVAVDGVSLTVIETRFGQFSVGLIPHSMQATTLGSLQPGRELNLEADVVARYVSRWQQLGGQLSSEGENEKVGLTEELLREKGFV